MKYFPLFLILLLIGSCNTSKTIKSPENKAYSFYVGTYTDGDSEGIYQYSLGTDGILQYLGLVAKTENPSFLALSPDKRFLVTVNEVDGEGQGSLESYTISADSLLFINRSQSGGAHPCFVTVNAQGYVLTANYTGGNVGLLRIDKQGTLSSLLDVEQHTGSDSTERQQGPHAHSAWFDDDRQQIISVDLGTNELWFSQLDTMQNKLVPLIPNTLKMPKGAGPRHLVFHPNGKWLYVVNELDCTVVPLQKTKMGIERMGNSVSTLPKDFTSPNFCADIHISNDGKFVYASNRGHNSLAIFSVHSKDGSLQPIGHISTYGKTPRNFAISPDDRYVLVANQDSNTIVSFKRDNNTGLLTYVSQIEALKPVCVLFTGN